MANEQVQIQVGVNAAGVQAGMNAAGQAAQRAGRQAASASQQAATATDTWQRSLARLRAQARLFGADVIGRLTATFGVIAIIDKMIAAVEERMQRSVEISKASRKAGLGAEDFQRVSRIAEETGASVDEAAAAAGRYAKMIRDAAEGNMEAIESLKMLGYTDAQARKGNIATIDVLARISAAYRNAATEAERLNILRASGLPRELLEAGPGRVAMYGATDFRSRSEIEREAMEKELEKRNPLTLGLFGTTSQDRRRFMLGEARAAMGTRGGDESGFFRQTGFGRVQNAMAGSDPYGIDALRKSLANENLTEQERGGLEEKLRSAFNRFAEDFRASFTGTTQGGVVQTRQLIEDELQRKFETLFPQYATMTGGVPAAPAVAEPNMATAVSSLQAIGGGGGFYAGATDMVSLATRTAEATEAIARNTERMANQRGGVAAAPAVYISAD